MPNSRPWMRLTTCVAISLSILATATAIATAKRPNFVVILTDDQDQLQGSMATMPNTLKIMADGGTQFNNFVVCTSLCCPSRTGFFTSLYTHNHNVTGNFLPAGGHHKFMNNMLDSDYLPVWMKDLGYNTYHVGKWLNSFDNTECPRGWTTFNAIPEIIYQFLNFSFSENCGKLNTSNMDNKGQHTTDFTRDYALKYIRDAAASPDKPFYLQVSPVAPHGDSSVPGGTCRPLARHMDLFPDAMVPRNPNLGVRLPKMAPTNPVPYMNLTLIDYYQRRRLQCLAGIDEMVQDIYNELETQGMLENTYIIYLSDNGYHLRNHFQAQDKTLPYEEDIRVPMFIRGPGIPGGQVSNYQGFMVDIAPTIVQLAGGELPTSIDGIPLPIPGFDTSPTFVREAVLSELWQLPKKPLQNRYPSIVGAPVYLGNYRSLRICTSYDALGRGSPGNDGPFGSSMHCYKYILWCNGFIQVFDLTNDMSELTNMVKSAPQPLLDRFDAVASVLSMCHGEACWNPFQLIHPDGGVRGLAEAMGTQYDSFYAGLKKYSFLNCSQLYRLDLEENWVKDLPGFQHYNPMTANIMPPPMRSPPPPKRSPTPPPERTRSPQSSAAPPFPPPPDVQQPIYYFQFYVRTPLSHTINVSTVQSYSCPRFATAINIILRLDHINATRAYPSAVYLNGCSDITEAPYPNPTDVLFRAFLYLDHAEWEFMKANLVSNLFLESARLVCGSSLHFLSTDASDGASYDSTTLPSLGAAGKPKLCEDELAPHI